MSDQPTNVSVTSTSPTNGTTWSPSVTVPTPVQVEPTQPAQAEDQEPSWLPKRLERARNEGIQSFLKELGVEEEQLKGVKVKDLIEAEKQRRDAEKSELQKVQEALAEAQPKITGYEALLKAFGEIVEAEIQAIPEAHRERANSLLGIAGDDPVRKMQVIRELKPLFGADLSEAKPQKQAPRNIDGGAGAATTGRKGVEPAPASELQQRFGIGKR